MVKYTTGLKVAYKYSKVGTAKGIRKGFVAGKRQPAVNAKRKNGSTTKKVKVVRQVIRETVGFAPYERRLMEIIKAGAGPKKAYKYAKARLGAHRRAKRKVAEMEQALTKVAKRK